MEISHNSLLVFLTKLGFLIHRKSIQIVPLPPILVSFMFKTYPYAVISVLTGPAWELDREHLFRPHSAAFTEWGPRWAQVSSKRNPRYAISSHYNTVVICALVLLACFYIPLFITSDNSQSNHQTHPLFRERRSTEYSLYGWELYGELFW